MKFGGNNPNLVMIQCGICGNSWWTLDATMACPTCKLNHLIAQLDAETLANVDKYIQQGRPIYAIKAISDALHIGLKEAQEMIAHRYKPLNPL